MTFRPQVVSTQRVLGRHQVLQEGFDVLQRRTAEPRVLQRGRVQGADAAVGGTASGDATSGEHFQKNRELDSKRSNLDMNELTLFFSSIKSFFALHCRAVKLIRWPTNISGLREPISNPAFASFLIRLFIKKDKILSP